MPQISEPTSSRLTVSVFGGSRFAEGSEPYETARRLGEALACAGMAVASGGYGGVMEAVSRGAAEANGHVIGVVAQSFSSQPNRWVQKAVVVETWEQRLRRLIAIGDGYVACAGGTGTLVELAVAWEMMHKRLLPRRPLVALGRFWKPLVEQIEAAEESARGLVHVADSPDAAVAILAQTASKRTSG